MIDIRFPTRGGPLGSGAVTRLAETAAAARAMVEREYPGWQIADPRPMFQKGDPKP